MSAAQGVRMASVAVLGALGLASTAPAAARYDPPPLVSSAIPHWETFDGVRVLVSRPPHADRHTPVLIMLHGLGPPNSASELAASIPPPGDTYVVYLPLPGSAENPLAGHPALYERQQIDYVTKLFVPMLDDTARELDLLLQGLRTRGMTGPVRLFGFSIGGAAALHYASLRTLQTVVALNAPLSVAGAVASLERKLGIAYEWHTNARAAAERYDLGASTGKRLGRKRAHVTLLQTADDDQLDRRLLDQAHHIMSCSRVRIATRVLVSGGHNVIAEKRRPQADFESAYTSIVSALMLGTPRNPAPTCGRWRDKR